MRPVNPALLAVDQVLTTSIFDKGGKLLLAAGQIIRSESQLELLSHGYYGAPPNAARVPRPDISSSAPRSEERSPARAPGPAEREPLLISSLHADEGAADIEPALGAEARLRIADHKTVYRVRPIGVVAGQSVVVSHPLEDGRLAAVKEGDAVALRGLFGKHVYALEGAVLKICPTPYPYLHVRWHPDKIERTLVRGSRRVPCKVEATAHMTTDAGAQTCAAVIHDLSLGGARIAVPALLPACIRLTFALELMGSSVEFDVVAHVGKRKDGGSKAGVVRYGVAFEALTFDKRLALNAWINEELIGRLECPLVERT